MNRDSAPTDLFEGSYLDVYLLVVYGYDPRRGGVSERGVSLARVEENQSVYRFVASIMSMTKKDDIYAFKLFGYILLDPPGGTAPMGMDDADSSPFNLKDCFGGQLIPNLSRIDITIHANKTICQTAQFM